LRFECGAKQTKFPAPQDMPWEKKMWLGSAPILLR
jgi:hypothetical protein